ncbi:MAG: PAS domain-containing protein [Vicinamibacterales bacterium]
MTPVLYWDWDPRTDSVLWSGSTEALLGVPAAEAPRSRAAWRDWIVPADRARVEARFDALGAGPGARVDLTYEVTVGGVSRPVLERAFAVRRDGRVDRVVGALTFLDERPPARDDRPGDEAALAARLAESEQRFRTFVEFLPLLAWEMDAEGWIYYYNSRWYAYTGTTPEQMEGWGWIAVHDPDDLPRVLRVFRHALQTGQPWEDEFRLRRGSDGAFRWHLSRAMPFRDAEGRIVRWFGTNTDVHDQKLALEERGRRLEAERALRQHAERDSRQKDEFIAVVSHELRSPLSAITGWAQLLQQGRLGADERARAADKIALNARLLGGLIGDLLDVSSIVTGKLTVERVAIDVREAIDLAVEGDRADAAARGVTIDWRPPPDPLIVLGSLDRLRQVIHNLLANAIRFSPEGGTVGVRAALEDDVIRLAVIDQGEGIPADFLPRLFDRFSQADASRRRRHGGLGLGLSIVRYLVEQHGGTVSAASEGPGRGARFDICLPGHAQIEAAGDAEAAARPPSRGAPASLAGLSVLAVDDEEEARAVLASVLVSCGATTTVVGSVAAAFEALRASVPDVVVSDISMANVDGYGLLARLRGSPNPRIAGLPVVALTAAVSASERARAIGLGFAAYLTKPFDVHELSHVVLEVARSR